MITVDGRRLQADLERLASFGRRPDGSIDRPAFTPNDRAAREWFAAQARAAGLPVQTDAVNNVLIGAAGESPAVWTGSHLDTVPNGGMFDGALGAVAALECLRRLREEGVRLARPVRAAAFSDEEGAFFGFLGSKALVHGLDTLDLEQCRSADDRLLADVLRDAGHSTMDGPTRLPRDAVHRYVELHIEQGPKLEQSSTQIGVVTAIVGVNRAEVRFDGRPDHAGTTPMHLRKDALRGAATLLEALPELPARAGRPEAVITCGRVGTEPGAVNVVPESAVVQLDFRAETAAGLEAIEDAISRAAHAAGARHGLGVSVTLESETSPTVMAPEVIDMIDHCATELGLSATRMPSGAGHDAQVMAALAPTGMIFVPSRDGRSHSRFEDTAWEDVINGANVLLATLTEFATQEVPLR